MDISVAGTGYVGLVTGACLSERGHNVVCVDIDERKVDQINNKVSPIYEEGLSEILEKQVGLNLSATTDMDKSILESDVTFICVGTPSREDGSIDLSFIEECAKEIGIALSKKDDFHVVVVKSTVVPGTTEDVVKKIIEKESGKTGGVDFGICMNPEFLREGKAVSDFRNPDRIVIGALNDKSLEVMRKVYTGFDCPILEFDPKTAEMVKYASNSFLAAKLSFINEVGNICKKLGIDVYDVSYAMGLDGRIAPTFLNAGPGFGGSCFPKDVYALVEKAKELGEEPLMLENLLEVNQRQPLKVVEWIKSKINLPQTKLGILGLAFKAGTDDMRSSPTIPIIEKLIKEEADILAYDPEAMENAREIFSEKINLAETIDEVLEKTSHILILTEWPQFKEIDYNQLGEGIIFDTRKIIDKEKLTDNIKYEGLCW